MEDLELINKIRTGQTEAYGDLVRKYEDRVFNTCWRICGHLEDARDVTQEAFLKAYEGLSGFRRDSGFYTWIFRIAVNLALTKRRDAAPLFRSRLVLAVAADDGLARRSRVALAELHRRPFVVRTHCEFLAQSQRLFEAHGVRPRIAYRSDQDERALALTAAELGLALIPDRLGHPGLAYLTVPELDLGHTIGLRWRGDDRDRAVDSLRGFALSHDWTTPAPSRLAWAH